MPLKLRIYVIAAVLVVVAIFVGAVGLYSMNSMHHVMETETELAGRVSTLKTIQTNIQDVLIGVREILINEDVAQMERQKAEIDKLVAGSIDPMFAAYQPTPENAGAWREIQGLWEKHKEIVGRIYDNSHRNSDFFAEKLATGDSEAYWDGYNGHLRKIVAEAEKRGADGVELDFLATRAISLVKSIQLQEKLLVLASNSAIIESESQRGMQDLKTLTDAVDGLEKYLANPDASPADVSRYGDSLTGAALKSFKNNGDGAVSFDRPATNLPPGLVNPDWEEASRIYWDGLKPLRGVGPSIFTAVYDLAKINSNDEAFRILQEECNPTRNREGELLDQMVASAEKGLEQAVAEADAGYTNAWRLLLAAGIVGIAAGVILSIVSVTSISRALSTAIDSLTDRSNDVDRISGQLASGANSLAEGATEQAASLEETSSALEEMASMTRQNADNAKKTEETTANTLRLIGDGSKTVQAVTRAMEEIQDSSEKTSNIIKTIEEIAFQTNLLALNAAVEAARAGEAGKGFAVVADEVRSLAQRSAQAAKDTSSLIEGTVSRVRNGADNVSQLAGGFAEIEAESQNVGRLVNEISAATSEQAQGVDQVNTAVAQMDKVTQGNAATAEESASAASDLSRQAANLNALIGDLAGLVYGRSSADVNAGRPVRAEQGGGRRANAPSAQQRVRALPPPAPRPEPHAEPERKVMKPSEIIPLSGDDEF